MEHNQRTPQRRDQTALLRMSTIHHALQSSNSSDTHNVIGVVIKISIDSIHSKAQILIADDTVKDGAYTRVSLEGSDTVTPSLAEVSLGDVLSFHGFQIRTHSPTKTPLVADFYSSWHEPQAGWSRLHRRGDLLVASSSCREQDEAWTTRIQELIKWFSTTNFHNTIPPLSCRRRRLSELCTAGMTTHVVARVASLDTTTAAPQPGSSRKRRRFLPLKRRQTTVAVLVDGNEIMPLLDCATHETALKQAIQSEKEILLTNLVTCAAEQGSNREIVLRPTDSTCIVTMPNDSSSASKPRPATETQQQCLSMTQDMPGANSTTQTISSPLMNVYIDELGVSLADGSRFVSPKGFASTMVNKTTLARTPYCYREATLTLSNGLVVVKADADIMQTLCGSIDAESLLHNSRLLAHVTDLMRGLLEEQVALTWTIEQTGDTYRVTRCFLPRL